MAGAGYKLFNTGDVLTAAQVNTYLQEQVVMVFANAAARTTALSGVLAEGMVTYLKDTDALEIYSGTAWVGYGSGDITGVTAGTGISGGGTSGTVTITNSMATEITAAGDIIIGTGSGTFDNLPIGTTGQVLTADTSVSPYKVKWATAAGGGGGKVLQVVSATYSTATTIASTTFTDTGLSLAITPTANTSKILAMVTQPLYVYRATETTAGSNVRLMRDATAILTQGGTNNNGSGRVGVSGSGTTAADLQSIVTIVYLDSPATTSSLTYKTQARLDTTADSASSTFQLNSAVSTITLLEIGA